MHSFIFALMLVMNGGVEVARFENPDYYKVKEVKIKKIEVPKALLNTISVMRKPN